MIGKIEINMTLKALNGGVGCNIKIPQNLFLRLALVLNRKGFHLSFDRSDDVYN